MPRELTWQVVVWLAAAGLAGAMMLDRGNGGVYAGIARGRVVQLSVPWDARVRAMPVEPFQPVRRGDVVGVLDDSVLEAQIAAVEAEIGRLRAEHRANRALLEAETHTRRSRWEADARSFDEDASRLAVALREALADLEYDRALLGGLEANAGHLERLVDRGHAATAEVELARAEAAATARRVEQASALVADLEARLAAAEARGSQFRGAAPAAPASDPAADHLTQAIAVQEALRQELVAQREQCVLRAPFDGTVLELHGRAAETPLRRPGEGNMRRPGESVGPGDPVVVVASERPVEIVAWAVEGRDAEIRPGLEVVLTATAPQRQWVDARVTAVGASVERLPERLWGQFQVPEWGRPFLVALPPGFAVAAGDRVDVRVP